MTAVIAAADQLIDLIGWVIDWLEAVNTSIRRFIKPFCQLIDWLIDWWFQWTVIGLSDSEGKVERIDLLIESSLSGTDWLLASMFWVLQFLCSILIHVLIIYYINRLVDRNEKWWKQRLSRKYSLSIRVLTRFLKKGLGKRLIDYQKS